MSNSPTVYVLHDDGDARRKLVGILDSAAIHAHCCDSIRQLIADADLQIPGCVLLDLASYGPAPLDVLKQLTAGGCEFPVILLTAPNDIKTAVRGLTHGAVDILAFPLEDHELIDSARRAIEKSILEHHRRAQANDLRRRIQTLTQREMDLLKLLVVGKSNKQSAADLGISVKTVANHRAHLMAKTQALNAADLARMSVSVGFFPQ